MELAGTHGSLLTGATGGLGGAIARALGARGARLILSGRRTDVLEPLAARGRRPSASPPTSPTGRAARRLADEAGDVDVLVANAGAARPTGRARRLHAPSRSTARST